MATKEEFVQFLDEYAQRVSNSHSLWQFESKLILLPWGSARVRDLSGQYGGHIRTLESLASALGLLGRDEWDWSGFALRVAVEWGAPYECGERPIAIVCLEHFPHALLDPYSLWWAPWRVDESAYSPDLLGFARSLLQGRIPVNAFFDFVQERGLTGGGDRFVLEEARKTLPKNVRSNGEMMREVHEEEAV